MSTAIDMPEADARLSRVTATADLPQDAVPVPEAADDEDDHEVKPWWAYVVEFFVIPLYWMAWWLWPTWVWERRGVRDQELFKLDLEIYWTRTLRDALDTLAYPGVHVPVHLNSTAARIKWRLCSWDWWTVKSWYAVMLVRWFWRYGPIMSPPFGIDPYNSFTFVADHTEDFLRLQRDVEAKLVLDVQDHSSISKHLSKRASQLWEQ
ncbi:hypothetical protein BLS_006310 [Venturia inaequalis]|uniref:Uncharacterized protein n=1 Tax=Venturia inaequalis TaxID=5025 RepID=A0A8H3UDL2_VENIN|nr:hypothetical protein BLS_006310 [Venturia inaequalis]